VRELLSPIEFQCIDIERNLLFRQVRCIHMASGMILSGNVIEFQSLSLCIYPLFCKTGR
jgi:hypothetical protein